MWSLGQNARLSSWERGREPAYEGAVREEETNQENDFSTQNRVNKATVAAATKSRAERLGKQTEVQSNLADIAMYLGHTLPRHGLWQNLSFTSRSLTSR